MADPNDPFASLAVDLNAQSKAERAEEARKPEKPLYERMKELSDPKTEEKTADEVAKDLDGVDEAPAAEEKPKNVKAKSEKTDETDPVAEGIEFAAEDFEPDTATIVQELRDFQLQTIKDLGELWHKMPQEQQADMAAAIGNASKDLVRKIVEAIAARGQSPVRVLLKKITAGDKIQITGEVQTFGDENADRNVLLLHHAIGKHVMLTRATVEDYDQGGDPETDADEPVED